MMRLEGSANSPDVENALGSFQASLSDLSGAMGLIAEDFRRMVAEQFATEGASGGTPWAALAPSTLRRKRGGGALIGSGALLRSLVDPEAPGHVEAGGKLSLEIGTDLPYALFHQLGAGWGRGLATLPPAPRHGHGVPMRTILVLAPGREQRWVGFVARQIQARARALGIAELGGATLLSAKFEG